VSSAEPTGNLLCATADTVLFLSALVTDVIIMNIYNFFNANRTALTYR